MRGGMHAAKQMKQVAALRGLQRRTAELASVQAEAARKAADSRHEAGRAALTATEQGWSDAMARPGFDPGLSGQWLHALGVRRSEAQALSEALTQAGAEAETCRHALRAAQARADAADDQAKIALRTAARRRDEARLATVEDRAAARWRAQ